MVVSLWCRRRPSRPAPAIAGGASVGSCSRQEDTTTAPPRRVVVVVVVLRAITENELLPRCGYRVQRSTGARPRAGRKRRSVIGHALFLA